MRLPFAAIGRSGEILSDKHLLDKDFAVKKPWTGMNRVTFGAASEGALRPTPAGTHAALEIVLKW